MSSEKIALTLREAAAASGLSRSTLYVLMSEGRLPSIKAAGRRLVLRDDLQGYLIGLKPVAAA